MVVPFLVQLFGSVVVVECFDCLLQLTNRSGLDFGLLMYV